MVHTDRTTVQCQNPVTYTRMFNGPYRQYDSSLSKSGDLHSDLNGPYRQYDSLVSKSSELHSDVEWSTQTVRQFSVKIQ